MGRHRGQDNGFPGGGFLPPGGIPVGMQPQPQVQQLQVASPMNDIQMIVLVAAQLANGGMDSEAAVDKAAEITSFAIVKMNSGVLGKKHAEVMALIAERVAVEQSHEPGSKLIAPIE